MQKPSAPIKPEPLTIHYPGGLYWTAILLAVVSALIHVYFGIIVYAGTNMIPMLGIAAIYLVGVILVVANIRRSLWFKIGTGWAALLIVLWAAAAFLGNASHATDPLAYALNGVEAMLVIVLLGLARYSRVETSPPA